MDAVQPIQSILAQYPQVHKTEPIKHKDKPDGSFREMYAKGIAEVDDEANIV